MRDRDPSVPTGTISNQQQAWLFVVLAMEFENIGCLSRKDAEEIVDSYFERVDDAAERMFPETEKR